MTEYRLLVSGVRAGRLAGKTLQEIAQELKVSYGVVSGIVQRYNIGLPEEARERIELMRRAKCKMRTRERFSSFQGIEMRNGSMTRPAPLEDDAEVFDIESRCDAWDEFGGAYLSVDDSY